MLDRRFLLVLATSVALAAAASALFYRLVTRARAQSTGEWKEAVVATRPLQVGSVVRPEMVRLARVPASAYPKGAFARVEEVVDRAVLSNVLPDEPVVDGRLAVRGGGFGLAPLIPEGMRAASVRVNDVVGVAGFVLPGMRVDVLVTGRPEGRGESATHTVLQDVTVLSAGQSIQPDPKGQAIAAQVVTLLVNPGDAETLTLANSEGHIHLVLRNAADRGRAATTGRTLGGLYRSGAPAPAAPPLRAASPGPRRTPPVPPPPAPPRAPETLLVPKPDPQRVVVMNGGKVTVQSFEPAGAM